MSEQVGFVQISADGGNPLLGGADQVADGTRELVDREVKSIVDGEHEVVLELLAEHREQLDALVERLLVKETLDQAEAYEAAGVEPVGAASRSSAP